MGDLSRHDREPRSAPLITGYTYQKRVGSGSFADVFQYTQQFTNRLVAVKVSREPLTGLFAGQTFDSEVASLADLSSHPCIVSLYSAGITDDRRTFLILEWCALESLEEMRKRGDQLDLRDALRLTILLCGAVQTAHSRGIVHGDIKPHNVLVTEYRTPKLADFGVASRSHDVRTEVGYSAPWAAPELLDPSARSTQPGDVYAIGATLYTLLSGHAPHVLPGASNSAADVVQRATRHEAPRLAPGHAPRQVADLMASVVALDPRRRPSSAVALGDALREVEAQLGFPRTAMQIPGSPELPLEVDTTKIMGDEGSAALTRRRPSVPSPSAPDPARAASQPRQPAQHLADESRPTPHKPMSRSRRVPLLVVAALVVALISAAGLAWSLTQKGGRSQPSAQSRGPEVASTGPTSTGANTTVPTSTPSPSKRSNPNDGEPLDVTCWNGKRTTSLFYCPLPTGLRGMQWVFPSMKVASCQRTLDLDSKELLEAWNCVRTLPNRETLSFRYEHWRVMTAMFGHYGRTGSRTDELGRFGDIRRVRWSGAADGVNFSETVSYLRQPWSATVYSSSPQGAKAAMRKYVRMRPHVEVRGLIDDGSTS